eukprot:SAG22_NODE_1185_length_5222_cov_123.827835_1_plen_77_part_00
MCKGLGDPTLPLSIHSRCSVKKQFPRGRRARRAGAGRARARRRRARACGCSCRRDYMCCRELERLRAAHERLAVAA